VDADVKQRPTDPKSPRVALLRLIPLVQQIPSDFLTQTFKLLQMTAGIQWPCNDVLHGIGGRAGRLKRGATREATDTIHCSIESSPPTKEICRLTSKEKILME
jgi:hypothetical protein